MLVRKNAATAIREIVKHTPELAKLVVNAGTHTHSSPIRPDCTLTTDQTITLHAAVPVPDLYALCCAVCVIGGAAALVDYVGEAKGNAKLPGIMAM